MATEYYTPSGTPSQGAFGASPPMRAEFALIDAAFQKFPVMAGHANEVVVVNGAGTALIATDTLTDIILVNPVFSGGVSVTSLTGDPDIDLFAGPTSSLAAKITGQTDGVNFIEIAGGAAGTAPTIVVSQDSAGADLGLFIRAKGHPFGAILFSNGDDLVFAVGGGTVNPVNYLQVDAGATGNAPRLSVVGTDTNAGITFATLGAGSHSFQTGGGTQVEIADVASVVNRLLLKGGDLGNPPSVRALGSDTNVALRLFAQGDSGFEFWTSTQFASLYSSSDRGTLQFDGANGGGISIPASATHDFLFSNLAGNLLQLSGVASAVNFVRISQAASGDPAQISAQGSGADVALELKAKGTSPVIVNSDLRIYGASAPPTIQSADYVLALADANGSIIHPSTDNNPRTFTIPANASVPYKIGTMLTFTNLANTVTIAINSDTLIQVGTGSTGSRTLPANGIATAMKVAATVWMIGGAS